MFVNLYNICYAKKQKLKKNENPTHPKTPQVNSLLPQEDTLLTLLHASGGDVTTAAEASSSFLKRSAAERWTFDEEETFFSAYVSCRGDFRRMLRKLFGLPPPKRGKGGGSDDSAEAAVLVPKKAGYVLAVYLNENLLMLKN